MVLETAVWMHANAAVIEYEDRVKQLIRRGSRIRIIQDHDTFNWIHFPLCTPIIVGGKRLALRNFFVLYQNEVWHATSHGTSPLDAPLSIVREIHVYDGVKQIYVVPNAGSMTLSNGLHSLNSDTVFWLPEPVSMFRAPSISVRVDFGPSANTEVNGVALEFGIDFSCVGMDFVIAGD